MDSGGWVCLYRYIFSFFPSFCWGTLGFLFRTFVPSRTFIPFCSSKFRPHTYIWLRLPCLVFMRSFVSIHIWGQTWPPPSAPYLVGSFCPLFRVDRSSQSRSVPWSYRGFCQSLWLSQTKCSWEFHGGWSTLVNALNITQLWDITELFSFIFELPTLKKCSEPPSGNLG